MTQAPILRGWNHDGQMLLFEREHGATHDYSVDFDIHFVGPNAHGGGEVIVHWQAV
jgi:hypothetical protein